MSRYSKPAYLAIVASIFFSPICGHGIDIVWDGGDGDWTEDAKWNGGQLAIDVFGRQDGWQFGSGEIGSTVVIPSGNVTFNTNVYDDLRFIAGAPENGGILTIGGGPGSPASLSSDNSFELGADQDGNWSQFNAAVLNLDNGVFRRTHTPHSDGVTPSSAGLFQFGGIRGFPNADIRVNLRNGGGIENDGQLTFGWYLQEANAVGRRVTFTIDNGYLDLTGSTKWDHIDGAAGGGGNADLSIHYGWDPVNDQPAGEQYAINFIGPGSITVDEGGILVVRQTAITNPTDPASSFDLDSILTPRSYQHLWDIGILQAHGQSGATGASFDRFFTVENSLGQANYKLISNVKRCDLNRDGSVDAADAGIMFGAWGSIPGLSADKNGDGFVDAADAGLMFAEWTGDSGPYSVPEPAIGGLWLVAVIMGQLVVRRS